MNTIRQSELLQNAVSLVAFATLKQNRIPTVPESVEKEASRLWRMVEHYYKIDKKVLFDLPQFTANFLQENYKEIVFGTKFSGLFIDDVPDIKEKF